MIKKEILGDNIHILAHDYKNIDEHIYDPSEEMCLQEQLVIHL